MIDYLLAFLSTRLGKGVLGLILVFILGIAFTLGLPKYLVTMELHKHDKLELRQFAQQGDRVVTVRLLSLQIDDSKNEKLKLQNFIDISQRGECTDSQRMRIEELNKRITKLEAKREELYNKLEENK